MTLVVSGFEFFQAVIYEVIFFLHKFLHNGAFQFGKGFQSKKGLSSAVFTNKILAVDMFISIRSIFDVVCKLTSCYVFSNILVLRNRPVLNPGALLAHYFKLLEFWGHLKKCVIESTMDMYLSGNLYATKIEGLKMLKNAKTASNFCFPYSKRLVF